ncbi:MAG: hypothetical protein FJ161_03790 [Gammaproteobacteria bacterium]|nr:hypothetical protein [Gammaproteobacteria bacterium]
MSRPKVNDWYLDEENDQKMEVIESKDDYIIVQMGDGGVQEFSLDDWEELGFVAVAPPDDWGLSWHLEEHLDDLDDRYESSTSGHQKRHARHVKEREDDHDEIDELAFSDDLDDPQDFDSH